MWLSSHSLANACISGSSPPGLRSLHAVVMASTFLSTRAQPFAKALTSFISALLRICESVDSAIMLGLAYDYSVYGAMWWFSDKPETPVILKGKI